MRLREVVGQGNNLAIKASIDAISKLVVTKNVLTMQQKCCVA